MFFVSARNAAVPRPEPEPEVARGIHVGSLGSRNKFALFTGPALVELLSFVEVDEFDLDVAESAAS